MKRAGYLALIFSLFVAIQARTAIAQGKSSPAVVPYVVTSSSANIRSGPGSSFEVVNVLTLGDNLLIYDETPQTPGWLRVYEPGQLDTYVPNYVVARISGQLFYAPSQEPLIEVAGKGLVTTEAFYIPEGVYRIDVFVQYNSFRLETIVVEGDCESEEIFDEYYFDANPIAFSGGFASSGCSVIFQTHDVEGTWKFALRSLLDVNVLRHSVLEIENGTTISGTGRALTMATVLPSGQWAVSAVVHDSGFVLFSQVLFGDCEASPVFDLSSEFDFRASSEPPVEVMAPYFSDGCVIFWETKNYGGGAWELTFRRFLIHRPRLLKTR